MHAAHTLGAKRSRILFREILPNVVPAVAAFALVAMGLVIVIEGSLALLGLSVEPPEPDLGRHDRRRQASPGGGARTWRWCPRRRCS